MIKNKDALFKKMKNLKFPYLGNYCKQDTDLKF